MDIIAGNTDRLREVLDDMRKANAPTVLLGSEEFQRLHAKPDRLRLLRDAFAAAGYETKIVIYLREQSRYAESLYSELSKTLYAQRFGDFIEAIVAHGVLFGDSGLPLTFEYSRLILDFADVFSPENIIVRPYQEGREPRALLDDYLHVVARVCGGLQLEGLHASLPTANRRATLFQLLGRLHEAACEKRSEAPEPIEMLERIGVAATDPQLQAPFSVLQRDEVVRLLSRFAADNAAVESMSGIRIPGARVDEILPPDHPRWAGARRQREVLDRAFDVWFT